MKVWTAGQVSLLLAKYDELNKDIPKAERRQLAVFVLARHVPVPLLEELFERPLGQTPRRHHSWMWWTAMRWSGLAQHWDEFAGRYNSGTDLRDCLVRLRVRASDDEWDTFSRRLGCAIFTHWTRLQPSHWKTPNGGRNYWSRGGVWDRRSGLTRIIVLGEHLERDHSFNRFSRALTPAAARLLEREVHNLVDEEALLHPDAVKMAVDYVRRRLPQLTGFRYPTCSLQTVAWFFQSPVPHSEGWWVKQDSPHKRRMHTTNSRKILEWLPTISSKRSGRPWHLRGGGSSDAGGGTPGTPRHPRSKD